MLMLFKPFFCIKNKMYLLYEYDFPVYKTLHF